MKHYPLTTFIGLSLLLASCSTVNLNNRKGKDVALSKDSYHQLEGVFYNGTIDSLPKRYSLYSQLKYDTTHQPQHLEVRVTPIDAESIRFELLENNKVIDTLKINGKYHKGYFKAKRNRNTTFIAGPLLWIISDDFKCLGLSNSSNLVVVNSGGSGIMWFTILPIYSAGRGQSETEHARIK